MRHFLWSDSCVSHAIVGIYRWLIITRTRVLSSLLFTFLCTEYFVVFSNCVFYFGKFANWPMLVDGKIATICSTKDSLVQGIEGCSYIKKSNFPTCNNNLPFVSFLCIFINTHLEMYLIVIPFIPNFVQWNFVFSADGYQPFHLETTLSPVIPLMWTLFAGYQFIATPTAAAYSSASCLNEPLWIVLWKWAEISQLKGLKGPVPCKVPCLVYYSWPNN